MQYCIVEKCSFEKRTHTQSHKIWSLDYSPGSFLVLHLEHRSWHLRNCLVQLPVIGEQFMDDATLLDLFKLNIRQDTSSKNWIIATPQSRLAIESRYDEARQQKTTIPHEPTFFNLFTAAFSLLSHFLAARCICFEVIFRLMSSSSSDMLFPMVYYDACSIIWLQMINALFVLMMYYDECSIY